MVSAGISIYNREYIYIYLYTYTYIFFFCVSVFDNFTFRGSPRPRLCTPLWWVSRTEAHQSVVFGFVSLWLLMMWFAFDAFSD